MITTAIDNTAHSQTSFSVSVSMDVEPNNVEHTSPVRFEDVEKIFIIRYPKARAATDIIAMAASPLIFAFFPERRSITALITVTGSTIIILFET